jgi:class 3 adenylate cyclase
VTAATACRTCGTEPREGARFCDGCGAPVTEQDTHAEYKQVTVLFADVVHSTDIAAAVDMELLRDIQQTHESLELARMETTRRSGSTTTHIRKDV